jgi:hypothetical protein
MARSLSDADRFGAYLVCPADEGGVVGSGLQVEPTELAQNDAVVNEVLRLLIAEAIEPPDHEHPQDHFHGSGVTPEPTRVRVTA